MSWASELYSVYETQCGKEYADGIVLRPVFQSTVNTQIELTIRNDGTFVTACVLTKDEGKNTPISVTEDSDSRTSGPVPMPYADKVKYLAGDYCQYVEGKNKEKSGRYHDLYRKQLNAWHESEYTHPAVDALYAYIEKGCLIRDLLDCHVLVIDDQTGKLDKSYKITGIEQGEAFVRIRVNGLKEPRTWADQSLHESFLAWNDSLNGDVGLCYATGRMLPVETKHPRKIRNPGDNAKLISANDESGFSYRGRFRNADEAIILSTDFSQKMHNALKWLIQRQGITIGNMVMVVWASTLEELPDIQKEGLPYTGDDDDDEMFKDPDKTPDTVKKYRDLLRERIFGSKADMPINHKVMLLCLDAATTGRLSISLYAEMEKSDFLGNLLRWHEETAWQRYVKGKYYINSFSIYNITNYAFGTERDSKNGRDPKVECGDDIRRETTLRLIPCITQGQPLPTDIMRALVHKASNPQAFKDPKNHRKTLETACGMIRKYHIDRKRGICAMAYDPEETDRSYLYGCLLAIADAAERATYDSKEKSSRETNARRYWNAFSSRPWQTWKVIEEHLVVYLDKLGSGRIRYERMLNDVMSKFDRSAYEDNSALNPSYLLGYHHYTAKIYTPENSNHNEKGV